MKFQSNWHIYSTSLLYDWCFSVCAQSCKSSSKLNYSNYRPVSLLSNIEKILEKPMYKRMYTFLNNNDNIYNLQLGFRQENSTSYAIINILKI